MGLQSVFIYDKKTSSSLEFFLSLFKLSMMSFLSHMLHIVFLLSMEKLEGCKVDLAMW